LAEGDVVEGRVLADLAASGEAVRRGVDVDHLGRLEVDLPKRGGRGSRALKEKCVLRPVLKTKLRTCRVRLS
jgi:hypothetical protein